MIKYLLSVATIAAAVNGCQIPSDESPITSPPPSRETRMTQETTPEQTPAPAPAPETPAPQPEPAPAPEPVFLGAQGPHIVDPAGNRVRLHGCNIGCWLLIEPWMLSIAGLQGTGSEKEMWDTVEQRFGKQAKLDLIRTYRAEFFTEADVKRIADLGLNCMRVPFWWRALLDPDYGGDWAYLDRCIAWGRKYGVYTIIDLHGAPGSQNKEAPIIGEPADGGLWTSDEFKRRTIEIWKQIAARYKDEPAVAGYDLLNESMGAPYDDMIELYDQIYKAIREIDPRHLVIIQDAYLGFHRFPLPADRGWSNIVYSFHYYPQNPEEGTLATGSAIPRFHRAALHYNVPIFVGEFNSILLDRGGVGSLLRMAEVFDYYGWAWTFWSYKKVEVNRDANWGLYGRTDSEERFDVGAASFAELVAAAKNLNTDRMQADAMMQLALGAPVRWSDPPPAPQGGVRLDLQTAMLLPGPKGSMKSEWGLAEPNVGFWLYGDTVSWRFTAPADGVYRFYFTHASQRESCPIQFWLDGVHAGAMPFTGTGSWDLFKRQAGALLRLSAGPHVLEINLAEREQPMNLRAVELVPEGGEAMAFDESQVWLRPSTAAPFAPKSPIRVEWLAEPPHFGFWNSGEKAAWDIRLAKPGAFQATASYATPTKGTRLTVLVDGQPVAEKELPDTGDWGKFASAELGRIELPAGAHRIELAWATPAPFGAGNLREVKLQRLAAAATAPQP